MWKAKTKRKNHKGGETRLSVCTQFFFTADNCCKDTKGGIFENRGRARLLFLEEKKQTRLNHDVMFMT